VVVAPIDIGALRAERARRRGHDMFATLRSEAYSYLSKPYLAPAGKDEITIESIEARIAKAKLAR
jgi:hypothetical protein